MNKPFDFMKDARSRTLIVAHRGTSGGNIPGNTPAAFDAALNDGADMIELDVERSLDGTLYCFHGGEEWSMLQIRDRLRNLTDDHIRHLRYYNADLAKTEHPVYKLDEIFEHLKGRCYINVDKFVLNMGPIAECIRRHSIQDQCLVKFDVTQPLLDELEQTAPDLPFMAVLTEQDDFTEWLIRSRINYVGAEACFHTEQAQLCQPEYIESMHRKGLILWANGIVYSYKNQLAAGHNDDISVVGRADEGWGWLLDRGFDLIQTDWPLQLRTYMNRRGL
ncbi:MAG: glycerophosphodiester phosphodiesterase family protein [Clostridia bacterium]|nr:glycerophosphodiester phosphodiesterase family protein [Clostridia bacterium]